MTKLRICQLVIQAKEGLNALNEALDELGQHGTKAHVGDDLLVSGSLSRDIRERVERIKHRLREAKDHERLSRKCDGVNGATCQSGVYTG